MELLRLTTSDSVKIAANYFPVDRVKHPNPRGWVVFLHMMPATKESWNVLAHQLRELGYTGLAIDLRGHGSSSGGPDGYAQFSDAAHQASVRDVDAAVDFLVGVGACNDRISIIGASIGANLALQYVAHHRHINTCIAFSPGLNYHGIALLPIIQTFPENKRLFLIGSRDDDRVIGNDHDIEMLWNAMPPGIDARKEVVAVGGHGTAILLHHPEITEFIISFLHYA